MAMLSPNQRALLRERVVEIVREIGVLIVAFAPLDAIAWNDLPGRWWFMLLFLSGGFLLLGIALALEVSRGSR